jgi:type I restriction enzyme S subunit
MIVETDNDEFSVPTGWDSIALGELADQERGITYGIVQPGQNTPNGVPIIRVQNIVDGTLDISNVMRVAPGIAAKYRRTCLRGGELLLSLVGSVGSSVIAPKEIAGWNTARAVAVVPLQPDIDARYIRFCLRSAPLQHWMEVWCNTTVQATLNLSDVARLPIPMPPKREREAIVKALSALDDKIELKRRMNRTLEELAAALFRSWFVDFDPVVANAAGRAPAYLRPELAALFPTTFQDSALGSIPHGWRVGGISDISTITGGGTPKTSVAEYWNGDISWFSVMDTPATGQVFVLETEKTITQRGLDESSTQLLPEGTTIITARGTVGNLALVGKSRSATRSRRA